MCIYNEVGGTLTLCMSDIFTSLWYKYSGSINSVEQCLELGESNVRFSTKWLLYQSIDYMLCKCVHEKFVTVHFCKEVDVLISLSWALGMLYTVESYSEPSTN